MAYKHDYDKALTRLRVIFQENKKWKMPDYLKLAVSDVCQGEKISLNQFIINALSQVPSNDPFENDRL